MTTHTAEVTMNIKETVNVMIEVKSDATIQEIIQQAIKTATLTPLDVSIHHQLGNLTEAVQPSEVTVSGQATADNNEAIRYSAEQQRIMEDIYFLVDNVRSVNKRYVSNNHPELMAAASKAFKEWDRAVAETSAYYDIPLEEMLNPTKERVDLAFKRRFDEGLTTTTDIGKSEKFLYSAIIKHYGGFKAAKEALHLIEPQPPKALQEQDNLL